RARGASLHPAGAEQATAEGNFQVLGPATHDGGSRTRLGTFAATVRALGGVEHRPAAKPIRQYRQLQRISAGLVALTKSLEQRAKHGSASFAFKTLGARRLAPRFGFHKSCPQYDRLKLLLHSGKSEICW